MRGLGQGLLPSGVHTDAPPLDQIVFEATLGSEPALGPLPWTTLSAL